jgi:hypothetical protein
MAFFHRGCDDYGEPALMKANIKQGKTLNQGILTGGSTVFPFYLMKKS